MTQAEVGIPGSEEFRYYSTATRAVKFSFKTLGSPRIAITSDPDAGPNYEISFSDDHLSKVELWREKECLHTHLIDRKWKWEFQSFWLTFYGSVIILGLGEDPAAVIVHQDVDMAELSHFGVRTSEAGGVWKLETDWPGWGEKYLGRWVLASGGHVPGGAFPAGFDGEQLYVGRVPHPAGCLLPGKIHPSHGVCYVAFDGREQAFEEYEVLCDCRGVWLPSSDGLVPGNALRAGSDQDDQPLYVGRGSLSNTITPGKVTNLGILHIPYAGTEFQHNTYEILVLH